MLDSIYACSHVIITLSANRYLLIVVTNVGEEGKVEEVRISINIVL